MKGSQSPTTIAVLGRGFRGGGFHGGGRGGGGWRGGGGAALRRSGAGIGLGIASAGSGWGDSCVRPGLDELGLAHGSPQRLLLSCTAVIGRGRI